MGYEQERFYRSCFLFQEEFGGVVMGVIIAVVFRVSKFSSRSRCL
jgi:hypothetical protein